MVGDAKKAIYFYLYFVILLIVNGSSKMFLMRNGQRILGAKHMYNTILQVDFLYESMGTHSTIVSTTVLDFEEIPHTVQLLHSLDHGKYFRTFTVQVEIL